MSGALAGDGAGGWETVVGLEVHAQLRTRSKLFCGCPADYHGRPPNTQTCPVCLGLPGALPVVNRAAVKMAVRLGLALGCGIDDASVLARKNYFYPDLPKGYQISQYALPIDRGGFLDLDDGAEDDGAQDDGAEDDAATSRGDGDHPATGGRRVRLARVHLEEDAAKTSSSPDGRTRVDFNRAGVPLLEIVSEPDLRGGVEAERYLRQLRELVLALGINDGNLEEGSFRCDANVSVRRRGSDRLGTRVELKNLNSMRFVRLAIEHEAVRQVAVLEAGGELAAETRGWDEPRGETVSLRTKEEAMDYRYFPDPDLPPLTLPPGLVEAERAALPELPTARRRRWRRTLGLTPEDARTLGAHPGLAAAFEEGVAALRREAPELAPADAGKRVANFVQAELLRFTAVDGLAVALPVPPKQVGQLLGLVADGTLSGKLAKQVLEEMRTTGRSPGAIVDARGLRRLADPAALRALAGPVVDAHPRQASQFRQGKTKVLGFFVGQVMKATGGRADPQVLDQVLRELLGTSPESCE